jgi:hypothetical protein
MPLCLLFLGAAMLSLRSGWLPFYQETCEASLKAYKNINSAEKR